MKYILNIMNVSEHLWTDLFQTWYDVKHYNTVQLDSGLNDLAVHSRSQGYGKARTCAITLLFELPEPTQLFVMLSM